MVWFYLSEARTIDDTLWSGVDRRRKHAAIWALYRNRSVELARERTVSDSLALVVRGFGPVVADHAEAKRYAEDQLMLCKQRSKNRWWTGFGVGSLTGVGATLALIVIASR